MNQNGLREMEKRAEAAASSWRVVAFLTIGVAIGKIMWAKVSHRLRRTDAEG